MKKYLITGLFVAFLIATPMFAFADEQEEIALLQETIRELRIQLAALQQTAAALLALSEYPIDPVSAPAL